MWKKKKKKKNKSEKTPVDIQTSAAIIKPALKNIFDLSWQVPRSTLVFIRAGRLSITLHGNDPSDVIVREKEETCSILCDRVKGIRGYLLWRSKSTGIQNWRGASREAADGDAAERNDWRIGSPVGPIPPARAKWIVDFSLTTSGNWTAGREVVETDRNSGGRDSKRSLPLPPSYSSLSIYSRSLRKSDYDTSIVVK